MRNEKFSYFIRIIAGAYLFYLAVQLVQGIAKGNMTGGSMILGICASILFFGAGAYFVLASIRGLLRMMRGDNEQKIEEEAVMEEVLEEKESAEDAAEEEKAEAESGAVEEAETEGEETAAAEKTVPAESDAGETEADAAGETDVDESVKEK